MDQSRKHANEGAFESAIVAITTPAMKTSTPSAVENVAASTAHTINALHAKKPSHELSVINIEITAWTTNAIAMPR